MLSDIERLEASVSKPLVPAKAFAESRDGGQIEERIVEEAVNETGFGRFNFKVMAVCMLIFMNVAFSLTSIGFVLPSAACDYRMTTIDKGRMSMSPMIGMLCGSYLWGCLAFINGRKFTLLISLFLHGASEFLASLMPFYWGFLFMKFISGAAMNGQVTIVFMYLGEFQPKRHRDTFLAWMEMGWVFGMLGSTIISWCVIPLDVSYERSKFFIHSWNLFVMICSLPAILIGTWLIFFPETPKYLAEAGRNVEMFNVLTRMFSENTGNSPEEYTTKLKNSGNDALSNLINGIAQRNAESKEIKKISLQVMIKDIATQTMTIVKPPYLKRTIVVCTITYFVMCCYYTLTLWLPELFQRYAEFEELYPNRLASVCTLKAFQNNTKTLKNDVFGCDTSIQPSVFLNSFILGLSCIPPALSLPLLVNRLGYTFFLVFSTLVPGVVTLCLFLVETSTQNLVVSCIFEALTSISNSIVFCLLVNLYPTNLRAMAAGLSALFSRIGAIIGNLMIGAMIDEYCTSLIIIIALQLFISGILALFCPGQRKRKSMENKPV